MMTSPNPRAEIAELTAALDALTLEFKSALEQQNTPPGEITGIERIPGILARAAQLTQQKAPLDERARAMMRYEQTLQGLIKARAEAPIFAPLVTRIQTLLREAEVAAQVAQESVKQATDAEVNSRRSAEQAGVDSEWIKTLYHKAIYGE